MNTPNEKPAKPTDKHINCKSNPCRTCVLVYRLLRKTMPDAEIGK